MANAHPSSHMLFYKNPSTIYRKVPILSERPQRPPNGAGYCHSCCSNFPPYLDARTLLWKLSHGEVMGTIDGSFSPAG